MKNQKGITLIALAVFISTFIQQTAIAQNLDTLSIQEQIQNLDQQIKILKRQKEVEQEIAAQKAASSNDIPVKWSGEIRIRSEADGRDFNVKTPYNLYTLSRVRLGASLALTQNIIAAIQLQDSRIFGEEKSGPLYSAPGSFSTAGAIKSLNNAPVDIRQAYINVEKFLTDEFSFRVGRSQISYGDQRIFSVNDWNNIGRAFDGIVARYALSSGFVDGFFVNTGEINNQPSSVSPASVRYVRDSTQLAVGGYFSNNFTDEFSGDAYAVYQSDKQFVKKDTVALKRTTLGAVVKGRSDALFGSVEASYQLGKKNGLNVDAYYVVLTAGYELEYDWLSTVSVNADVLSGRKEGETDAAKSDVKSYETFFSTGHRFFGLADYFTSFPAQTYDRGLVDLYLRVISKPWNNFTLTTLIHNFTLQNTLALTASSKSDAFGQELDVVSQWKYSKNLTFELGAVGFIPGDVARNKFGASDVGTWGYFTTQINF